MPPAPDPQSQLLDAILARAASDPVFRKRLLHEPSDAIRDTFGVHIPISYRIRFIEKGPDVDALIVLPDPRDDGLSDDELDDVAGGTPLGPPPLPGTWAS